MRDTGQDTMSKGGRQREDTGRAWVPHDVAAARVSNVDPLYLGRSHCEREWSVPLPRPPGSASVRPLLLRESEGRRHHQARPQGRAATRAFKTRARDGVGAGVVVVVVRGMEGEDWGAENENPLDFPLQLWNSWELFIPVPNTSSIADLSPLSS